MKITKEEFFKIFDLELQQVVLGNTCIQVAKPNTANDVAWKYIIKNKIDLDEIIKISTQFSFTTSNDWKFVFTRKQEGGK